MSEAPLISRFNSNSFKCDQQEQSSQANTEQNGDVEMRSNSSISEYRSCCAEYILNGFKYPRMYFSTLQELEWILFGHALAHEQLGLITRDDAFNDSFRMWLYKNKRLSCESGWDRAIQARSKDDEAAIAKTWVIEFLDQWAN